jgi:hypothetical protein
MTQETALTLPEPDSLKKEIMAINRFQQVVRANMVQGSDYGVIPGTGNKPTLLKPGAEKIAKLLGLADQYEILDRQEDWQAGFFRYLVKCSLSSVATSAVISEGLGECNSMESKYRWRWVFPDDVPEGIDHTKLAKKTGKRRDGKGTYTQYRVENDDVYSQVNTILKMAKKRALVDAALSAGRLSEVFTQDIEDIKDIEPETEPVKKTAPKTDIPVPETEQPVNLGDTVTEVKNLGELFQACKDRYGMTPTQVLKELGTSDKSQVGDPAEAWGAIKELKGD